MASSFADFSQLKALKKELEKDNTGPGTTKGSRSGPFTDAKLNMTPKRSRTVMVKSREEMLGAQTAREHGLSVGMTITLMDTNDRGRIKAVWKDHIDAEIDGMVFPVMIGDFIVNDAAEDEKMMRSVRGADKEREKKKPVVSSLPNEVTVDLHIERIPGGMDAPQGFELPFQIEYFKQCIRKYRKHRGMKINIVHGVGDGTLRDAIRKEIDETFAISCSWSPGIAGVTVVTIK